MYFPALCTTERKKSILTPGEYTYSIGWFAECQNKFHYFPVRFLHVLLLRLAYGFAQPVTPCKSGDTDSHLDIVKSNYRCAMWRNGLHWHMEKGVECVVELVSNCKGIVIIIKSIEDKKSKCKCAEVLSEIINISMKTKEEFCDIIALKQYLMPLNCKHVSSYKDRTKLFDLKDISRVLREGKQRVLSIKGECSLDVSTVSHLKRLLTKGISLYYYGYNIIMHALYLLSMQRSTNIICIL